MQRSLSRHAGTTDLYRLVQNERWSTYLLRLFMDLIKAIILEIHDTEMFFVQIKNLYAFICQVSFFMICDTIFEGRVKSHTSPDKHVIIALSTVLFYSVIAYFVSKLHDFSRRNRVLVYAHSFNGYLKWICKIILEWAKALVVVLCLKEQGIDYQPKLIYTLVTFFYYFFTEKVFVETVPEVINWFQFKTLEDMEHLYVPFIMNACAILIGSVVVVYSLAVNYRLWALLSMYFITYLRIKDVYFNQWKNLVKERQTYESFRVATNQDIDNWADICAICLSTMSRARITPCNHLFHPSCLRKCIKTSFNCPLCKKNFAETDSEIKLD